LVGGPGVRYTSPFAPAVGQKPRRNALCPSVAPAPRRAGQPSRRPIRPKRAAVSRLFAQNVKRDLARLENREIAAVLERGGWSHNSDFEPQKRPSFCELTPLSFCTFGYPPFGHLWLSRLDAASKGGAEVDAGHVSGALAVTRNDGRCHPQRRYRYV
jgi:hypothetical protein